MTRKSSRKPQSPAPAKSKKSNSNGNLAMLPVHRWVRSAIAEASGGKVRPGVRAGDRHGRVLIVPQPAAGEKVDADVQSWLAGHLEGVPSWQRDNALKIRPDSVLLADDEGPIWVLMPKQNGSKPVQSSQGGAFDASPYGRTRDLAGACVTGFREYKLERVTLAGIGCTREHWLGALVGIDLGAYRFTQTHQNGPSACKLPALVVPGEVESDDGLIDEAAALAFSINTARHLVNLPANKLNPATYADLVRELFKGAKTASVKVLDHQGLASEGMNLLRAVGAASPNPPCLVHIRYRPPQTGKTAKSPRGKKAAQPSSASRATDQRPIAVVGKGITFDTGGLDIKPSSGMRWMKKDMGGSATVLGLALYAEAMQLPTPMDFYLAIAENSVSGTAMRPGDVYKARNGMTVEIHNTDAEGRLVMADAFDYALTRPGDDEPRLLIDASTLTGAMRVAVGLAISGMFANDDTLAGHCIAAGQRSGDPCWRLPLFDEYKSALKSQAADLSNCSDSSFGGAITAALFLEKFTRGKPWVHFDFYAWTDRASGAMTEAGGNAQALQLLVEFVKTV